MLEGERGAHRLRPLVALRAARLLEVVGRPQPVRDEVAVQRHAGALRLLEPQPARLAHPLPISQQLRPQVQLLLKVIN